MAKIFSKKSFTMEKGEIRVPWREEVEVPDESIIKFIEKDPIYSRNEKWRSVFDVISFGTDEFNLKYNKYISNIGRIKMQDGSSLEFASRERGVIDERNRDYDFDRKRKIDSFVVANNFERVSTIEFFDAKDDVEALVAIRDIAASRGDNKWKDDVDLKLRKREYNKEKLAILSEANTASNQT